MKASKFSDAQKAFILKQGQHLDDFVAAYKFARRLKRPHGLTPYEFICKAWVDQPERFTQNPNHQSPRLKHLRVHYGRAFQPELAHIAAADSILHPVTAR